MQLIVSSDSFAIREAKQDYANAIAALNEKLNRYLSDIYGLGTKNQGKRETEKEQAYRDWIISHQPFHWFAEFYEIISRGGFDVVIGNPPYVEYSTKKYGYEIKSCQTKDCRNLYAFIIEKSISLINRVGKFGMIVPIASISTDGMKNLQNLYLKHNFAQWHSNFATRPGKLFQGVDMNLTMNLPAAER
jgi:hypothetical protein